VLDRVWGIMGLVIIGDHDGIGQGLRNHVVSKVLDGEDDLKAQFLVLVTTIASNAHGQLDLHRGCWVCWRSRCACSSCRVLGDLCPFFDFIGVEDNDSSLLVSLEQLFLVRLLLFLARCSFPLSLNATNADPDLAAIQGLVFVIS
jgi:hypothetical protein